MEEGVSRAKGVLSVDLMVVQIGFSVWAGTATPPPVGCPPELYELMGNFSFVLGGHASAQFYRLFGSWVA